MSEYIRPGYTRVSEIASAFSNYHMVPVDMLSNAANRGTHIHGIIDDLLQHKHIEPERYTWAEKDVSGYIQSWCKAKELLDIDVKVYQETRFYDDTSKITGQMDLVFFDKQGNLIIADWKTSSKPAKHWEIQAGGYVELLIHGYTEKLCESFPHTVKPTFINKIVFALLCKGGHEPLMIEYDPDWARAEFRNALYFYRKYLSDREIAMEFE